MVTSKTKDVSVSVIAKYQPYYSNPSQNHFVFSYQIRIENLGENTIQLKRRHWNIIDSNGNKVEVEGEGVVGLTPVLEPGEIHEYISGSNLHTELGIMYGTYLMERLIDGDQFFVKIPKFNLEVPYKLN
jgi:ApaG protein